MCEVSQDGKLVEFDSKLLVVGAKEDHKRSKGFKYEFKYADGKLCFQISHIASRFGLATFGSKRTIDIDYNDESLPIFKKIDTISQQLTAGPDTIYLPNTRSREDASGTEYPPRLTLKVYNDSYFWEPDLETAVDAKTVGENTMLTVRIEHAGLFIGAKNQATKTRVAANSWKIVDCVVEGLSEYAGEPRPKRARIIT